ncbi:MAG: DUF454 family protein [Slackia sp.]
MKRAKNCGWIALGCVCLSLGTVGLALPVLPTVPLYIATLFCFARLQPPVSLVPENKPAP